MKKISQQKNRAFTLVETLVAISIFTVSLLGIMSILASSVTNTIYTKQKMTATYLAQEGIEYIRNVRDTAVLYDTTSAQHGWDNFKSTFNPSYPITDSDFTGFIRTISMTPVTSDEVKITSTVSWNQGSGPYSVIFSEDLFNWVE